MLRHTVVWSLGVSYSGSIFQSLSGAKKREVCNTTLVAPWGGGCDDPCSVSQAWLVTVGGRKRGGRRGSGEYQRQRIADKRKRKRKEPLNECCKKLGTVFGAWRVEKFSEITLISEKGDCLTQLISRSLTAWQRTVRITSLAFVSKYVLGYFPSVACARRT